MLAFPQFRVAALMVAAIHFLPCIAHAQDTLPRKAGSPRTAIQEEARPLSGQAFDTRILPNGRIDLDSRVLRARYNQAARKEYRQSEAFLKNEAQAFGWSKDVDDLVLVKDNRRPNSRHLTYQQTFKGLPVAGRTVRVNMDREGRVSMVTSAFQPVDAKESSFDVMPDLNASAASDRALSILASGSGLVSEPRLVIHDPAKPSLAWELLVWPEDEPAEFKVWVDAQTGRILEAFDQALSKHDHEAHAHVRTDGAGYVFDPDPLFATGASYGPPYIDNNDLTNTQLDAARKSVTLRDISQNGDGKWVLEGPYVRITGQNQGGTTVYDPPAMDAPNDFFFDRSDERFEAVNAYYHIDTSQRYIQSLGFLDVQNEGVEVNPHGLTRDDSFYYPDRNMIIFGSGGVDDAEDPAVVIHEYGHAVLNAAAPGLLSTPEGRALHEGFADFWQASYYRNLVETGQTARDDWRWVFLWDSGEGQIWNGRYLDHTGKYPQDICVASTSGGSCSVHDDGRMWATTLMQVWDEVGRDITDRLVLFSHYYLEAPVTFADAAQAVIQADFDYFDGQHAGLLIDIFSDRGLVSASQYGPVVEHVPLLSTEQSNVAVPVEAVVRGVSASISEVSLTWFSRTMAEQTVAMTLAGDDLYTGELQLPAELDTVFYYLTARDEIANESFDPAGAPQEVHSFVVGVDEGPPAMTHDPIVSASFLEWPARVTGSAEDNFGIESVELVWEVRNPDGGYVSDGTALLSGTNGAFDAPMPIPLALIENGSQVVYSIKATDSSAQKNTTRLPESGDFTFPVVAGAVLRAYDFDDHPTDVSSTGEWDMAAPAYGMRISPGGGSVAATQAASAYTDQPSVSFLELPALNLARVEPVHLKFWHFFDTEANGWPDPTSTGAELHDGGFLQVRTASSSDWSSLQPASGYPGTLLASGQNPMAGQQAFGGFSQGWRRVQMPLPQEDGVQVRFVFATNQGNTAQADRFAGWMIEGLSIGSEADVDQAAPSFSDVPPDLQVYSTQAALPIVEAFLTDDLGVQDAWMDWSLTSGSIQESGSIRMTQSMDDLGHFSAGTDFLLTAQPGDELMVSLRAGDASGNEQNAGPFAIRFRLFGSQAALTSVWAEGNWEALGEGWVFRSQPSSSVSGLVLTPTDTQSNAQALSLVLDHEPRFGDGSAGLIEVSNDGGATWSSLAPVDGYPGTARLDPDNPLNDKEAFVGLGMRMESIFDLSAWNGQQLQVRFLAASEEGGGSNQHWRLFSASFNAQTDDPMFEQASRFELHDAFPNPFSSRTRLTWSVEDDGPATLQVFDSIGREIATLMDDYLQAGTHAVTWETASIPSGVYFVRLQSGGQQSTKTIVRLSR